MNFKCCSGKNCNTNNYEMAADPGEPNGRVCPSCFNNTMEACTSEKQIMCRGPEDKCFEYRGRVKTPDGVTDDYVTKGCASHIACDLGYGALIGVQEIFQVFFNCT
ncbi:phospholipase A2 inhibitor and Ly6/PLAUR domain-containing protein-like [Ascaphus truei]|uniref:phospholipase A2 inhibitor and Ly6/PLAUR domain-containing protein-like n=1 Tax=Ascaphus truei TaxID=8439 RepID=UPI003F59FC72